MGVDTDRNGGAAAGELQLKGNDELLQLFVEYAPASMAMFDRDMRYLYVSRRWLSDYGLEGRNLHGLLHYEIFPDIPERWKEAHRRGLAGEVLRVEADRFERANGSVQWVRWEVRPWRDTSGVIGGIVIFTEDITGRKEAEETLVRTDGRLNLALAASHMGVWEWDLRTDAVYWSPECYEIVGLKDFDGAFSSFARLLHPDDEAHVMATVKQAVAQQTSYRDEFRIIRPDGETRWLSNHGRVTYDSSGAPLRLTGTVQDVTERMRIDKMLLDKNAELESFSYTVAHDLKSPLITIQSFAGLMRKDLQAGRQETMLDDLGKIADAADRMSSLLDELLELSRAGRVLDDPTQIDMGGLVADVLAQLAGPLEEKRIELTVQPDLPTAHGDRQRVAAVVQNLVENAIKYMGDQSSPRIEIGVRESGRTHIFFVRDNGKGIEPQHRESIFGLFKRFDTGSHGSGIGLALVKRIVEVHGGRVWVESTGAGKGSTFCFTLS